jgi:2-keto-3-deoxy-L-rhamnonate aldolase RhmA
MSAGPLTPGLPDPGPRNDGPLNHGALAAAVRSGVPTLGTFIGTASPLAAEVCAAVAVADQIAALDGVDVLFVGPRDLSHDLDVPGDLTAPAFIEATDQVLAACRRHGKAAGLLVSDGTAAARRLEQGWSFVGIGSDATLLAAAVGAELGRARAALKPK